MRKRDENTRTEPPVPAVPALPQPATGGQDDDAEEPDPAVAGDDLARRAVWAAIFGLLFVFLLPISWYYLLRLVLFSGELSPRGVRYLYGALLVNGLFFLVVFVFWASGLIGI